MASHPGNTADYRAETRIIAYTDKETKDRLLEICAREEKTQSAVAGRILREALASDHCPRCPAVP